MIDLKKSRTAIVYDWVDKWGGVERVLLTLSEMFPQADWYTSYYDPEQAPWAKNLNFKTSFIQKLPSLIRKNRLLSLLFYPYAFESFNFSNYDLVISVSSSFAKSVITKPGTLHICYLLTPTRYFWKPEMYFGKLFRKLDNLIIRKFQSWDFVAAQRLDHIISISKTVNKRVKKFYKRDSEVIYPPFDPNYWQNIKSQIANSKLQTNPKFQMLNAKFYLVVSRLEPYKRVDLVVQLFKHLNENLVIVGKGSMLVTLKRNAGKNVTFFSDITDTELGQLYKSAGALIMPQEEEFGYVSLEAQFFGCPVIAYRKGGATETSIDGKTGVFFEKQTEKSLMSALARFNRIEYNLKSSTRRFGANNTERFNKKKFVKDFLNYL